MTPMENLKTAFRSHVLNASQKLEDAIKEIEAGVDVLGRDLEAREEIRKDCAILDETCNDCGENCPAAGYDTS